MPLPAPPPEMVALAGGAAGHMLQLTGPRQRRYQYLAADLLATDKLGLGLGRDKLELLHCAADLLQHEQFCPHRGDLLPGPLG
jgi:hypothetical protein